MTDPPPPRTATVQRRDARRNRQRILQAVRELVIDHGLNVSHEEVAIAADVAVGTVYRHFPDRAVLIDEALADHVDAVVERALTAEQLEDPWKALVTFMETGLESRVNNQGLHELVMGSVTGHRLAIVSRERIAPVAARIIDRCHQAGVLRSDVTVYDLALVPLMIGTLGNSARLVDAELWRRHLAIILDGLRYDGAPLPGQSPTAEGVDSITDRWRPRRRSPKHRS